MVIALLSLVLVPACEDDPARPQPAENNAVRMALTSRQAVLNNIEVAYNKRQALVYDELLDEQFTFFFSTGDVGGGLPVQWDRLDEMSATTALFSSNKQSVPPANLVCLRIALDISIDNLQWDPIVPDQFPTETWYSATCVYAFRFDFEDDRSYSNETGTKAQFVVRNVGTDENPQWRLVEMRDLGASLLTSALTEASSESKSWGGIKALYR